MFDKLKNKKVNFFGKSISMFAIVMIAVIGMGSAALVAYLSNSITGNVVVESPVVLSGANSSATLDAGWAGFTNVLPSVFPITSTSSGDLLASSTLYGGGSDKFYIKVENKGSNVVESYLVFEVKNNKGLTITGTNNIDDFNWSTIKVYDWENSSTQRNFTIPINSVGSKGGGISCSSDNKTCRVYVPTYLFSSTDPRHVVYAEVNITLPINAIGTYTIKGAVMNDTTAPLP